MPFKFDISTEEKIIYVTGFGDVGAEEDHVGEIVGHPDFNPHFDCLADFTSLGKTPPPSDMRKIASTYWKYRTSIKGNIAIVVDSSEVRKASILANLLRPLGIRMEVYGDMESAREFLQTGKSWG
jgi:hypothetical protein